MRKSALKIAAAFCFASVAAFSTPAAAITTDLGQIAPLSPVGLGGVLSSSNPSDTLIFSLGIPENVGGALAVVPPIVFGSGQIFGLSDVQASFYSGAVGTGNLLGSIMQGEAATFSNLTAGDYYVMITGTPINPVLGGTYAISLMSTAAAPAPGPAGLAIAAAGAASVMWRRRRQSRRNESPSRLATA